MEQSIPRLLVDTCVYFAGVTHHTYQMPVMLRWGNRPEETFYRAVRSRRRYHNPWDWPAGEAAPYIAALVQAARRRDITLLTTDVIWDEIERKQNKNGWRAFDLNIMKMAAIERIQTPRPIAESYVIPTRSARDMWPGSDATLRRRIVEINDRRLQDILRAYNGHHLVDAHSVWLSEKRGLDSFVTLDGKFLRLTSKLKLTPALATRVLSPRGACELLGLQPLDPDLLSEIDLAARGLTFLKMDGQCPSSSTGA